MSNLISEMAQALGDPRRSDWALRQLCYWKRPKALIEALLAPPVLVHESPLPHTRMTIWNHRLAQRQAAEGLGRLRAAEAVEPLVSVLPAADGVLRVLIVWALGSIGHASAAPAMVPLLGEDGDVLAAFVGCSFASPPDEVHSLGELAAWSLRRMGQEPLVDAFEGTLRGEQTSLTQLKTCERKGILSALLSAVRHSNPVYSAHAVLALGEFGATEALPRLRAKLRMLDHASELVRHACEKSIGQLEMLAALPRVAQTAEASKATLPRVASSSHFNSSSLPRSWIDS